MPTTLGGRKIVTVGSGHKAISNPAVSLFPPPPPGVPVPTPIPYFLESAKASGDGVKTCLKVSGDGVVVKNCKIEATPPANTGSQPTGSDIISHAEVKYGAADDGDDKVQIDSMPICCTGHPVRANMLESISKLHQAAGVWMEGGGTAMGGTASGSGGAQGGSASDPNDALSLSDPVTAASGRVVDACVDLMLPGAIELVFERHYRSTNSKLRSSLGRGGWTHSLDQWLELDGEGEATLALIDGDGRKIWFPVIEHGASTFHRRERLTLERKSGDTWEITSLATGIRRTFGEPTADGGARLTAISDRNGHAITLEYRLGHLARVVDTAGREVLFSQLLGRVTRVEVRARGQLLRWVDYGYTMGGELAVATNAVGDSERYAYDTEGRMIEKVLSNGVTFRYTYNATTGRCVRVRGDGGLQDVELAFDLDDKTTTVSGEEARRYTWDDEGFIVKEESLDGSFVLEREYDDDHYTLACKDGAGETVKFEYDARGHRTKAIDPAGNVTEWVYYEDELVERIEPNGASSAYTYDARGNLESIRDPNGATRTFTYDPRGRLAGAFVDGKRVAGYDYDDQHNLIRELGPHGAVTERTYDALGRTVESKNAFGATTRVAYDALSRPARIEQADGVVVELTYDARGNIATMRDSTGREHRLTYAGTGVLVRYLTPEGQSWRFEYDSVERLRAVKNPRGETYELRYDRIGRILEEKSFDERTIRYAYNKSGRVSRITYPDGGSRTLTYDKLGYVAEDRAPDSVVTFERDEFGRIVKATLEEHEGTVTNAFERDWLGRVTREDQGGLALEYSYDGRGRRTSRTIAGSHTTRYAWSDIGALDRVDHGTSSAALRRDVEGRLTNLHVYPGSIDVDWRYDAVHRLRNERVTSSAPLRGAGALVAQGPRILVERRFGYDAFGRPAGFDDARWGAASYAHDAIGRVVSATVGKHRAAYEYDPTGSMVRAILDGVVDDFGVDTGNVLRRAGNVRYDVDARHRRRRVREGGGDAERVTRYWWDGRDRLRDVWLPDGTHVHFAYDAFGRRVKKLVERVNPLVDPTDEDIERALASPDALAPEHVETTRYAWDDGVVVADVAASGKTRVFVHHPGSFAPLFHVEGDEVLTYVLDPMGTPRELIDGNGEVAWAAIFTPWGELLEQYEAPGRPRVTPPFRLLGQYYDEDTGHAVTQHRLFDAKHARWLTPDPLGYWGGTNLFGWTGSPLTHADPLGLASCYLLNDKTAATFKGGQYKARVLTQDELLWRAGQKGSPDGQFYDAGAPRSEAQARSDKAILPQWPDDKGGWKPTNTIDQGFQARVPAKTVVYDGPVAPQTAMDGKVYPGDTNQTVVPFQLKPPSDTPPDYSIPRFPVVGQKDLS